VIRRSRGAEITVPLAEADFGETGVVTRILFAILIGAAGLVICHPAKLGQDARYELNGKHAFSFGDRV
jgi:hypothetical protein